ncbi:helix-turn-helix transcriptional regulator [Paenibacillus sp. DMB5]|uniref:helix-turn-helix transcriptional regulator n=1 Tax=Paenibacillus sp. DMB5 TaxID=1780103 RepID=UPI00076DBCDD|nr:helix-turn-helix transcriptional regulator [Paenibacillus sp. DMB5]KUP26181.1 hypothetical protein AWJ19_25700 [Paenibacillus sp. DMB5]KUP26193.1 hypothetical protein AWJ19_25760 [Paenibacillus sp. DMB5]KUP26205.1 hypothetical protein AWJ19_25820 [Paenibacillus sp. DMB5]
MTYTLTPDALRIVRNVRNLTQQQLADLVTVDRSTISKIEAGSRSITTEVRSRLELALDWNDTNLQGVISTVQQWKEAKHRQEREENNDENNHSTR